MKRYLIYVITIIVSIMYIVIGNKVATKDFVVFEGGSDIVSAKAKITEIVDVIEEEIDLGDGNVVTQKNIFFSAKIISGEHKGEIVAAVQNSDGFYAIQPKEVVAGDKVLIFESDMGGEGADWILLEPIRTDALAILGFIFCVFLIIFGLNKGVNTILALLFTLLAIFAVFIPAVLAGLNIYLWSIVTCTFIIIMTLIIVYGANKKSFAAGIGCLSGILVAGSITLMMDKIIKLTGMINEETVYLQMLNPDKPIDLKAIIFAAIIIGAIGAIMDVSMSIASSLLEVHEKAENLGFKILVKSGITIGRDMMGTMVNTLVLAYIGGSLALTLLLVAYNNSLMELLNKEMIIVEILQALVGSFGILATIPLTTFVCASLYTKQKKDIL